MNRDDLKVDQAMVVWMGIGSRKRYDARVAKIARKYVTLEVWISPGFTREVEFSIDGQTERNGDCNYAAVFATPAEQELADRERDVRAVLKSWGVSVSFDGPTTRRRPTLDQMEAMARLLEQWGELVGEGDEEADDSREEAGPRLPG